MSQRSVAEQDLREVNVIFVHSKIDDHGLSPAEFRVYCHLARRAKDGVAWPGIRSMAEVCRMDKATVCKSIGALESRQMIAVDRRQGLLTRYTLTPISQWVAPAAYETAASEVSENTERLTVRNGVTVEGVRKGVTERPKSRNTTVRKSVTKGYPIKDIQEGDPDSARKALSEKAPTKEELPSEHHSFIQDWCEAFEAQWDAPYNFQDGRDGKAVKHLLSAHGKTGTEILQLALRAWSTLRPGYLRDQSVTIHGLDTSWSQIVVNLKQQPPVTSNRYRPEIDPNVYMPNVVPPPDEEPSTNN